MKDPLRFACSALAAVLCTLVFASCGFTPLYYPPVDDDSPAEMLDPGTADTLLKTGTFHKDDEDITVVFTSKRSDGKSKMEASFDACTVRGLVTVPGDKDDTAETWLPILVVPFKQDGAQYFLLAADTVYMVEQHRLNPEFVFMTRPYSYILAAEPKDGGWEVGVVQFATTGSKVRKVAEKAVLDPDGTVLNPSAEVLEMLKDPKNYEIPSKWLFLPGEYPAKDAPAATSTSAPAS